MSFPTRIRLLSQRIAVREVENLHVPCEDPEGQHVHEAYGIYDERPQRISLDKGLPFERQRETLLHESLHAMFSITNLDTILSREAEGLDEHIVSVLSPVLLAFLRENPRTVAYLQEVQS